MKIIFKINPSVDYFPNPVEDWDGVAHQFADVIAEKYPEAQEVRFDGCNTSLTRSIEFDVQGGDSVHLIYQTLFDLWLDFDVYEY